MRNAKFLINIYALGAQQPPPNATLGTHSQQSTNKFLPLKSSWKMSKVFYAAFHMIMCFEDVKIQMTQEWRIF
jgi:hypothetical protein